MPSDVNKQQPVGQVDAVQSLVFDMIEARAAGRSGRTVRGRRPLLHESQGANKGVEMMVPELPELSSPFRIVGTRAPPGRRAGVLPVPRCSSPLRHATEASVTATAERSEEEVPGPHGVSAWQRR